MEHLMYILLNLDISYLCGKAHHQESYTHKEDNINPHHKYDFCFGLETESHFWKTN
jgi:hypothetical protein